MPSLRRNAAWLLVLLGALVPPAVESAHASEAFAAVRDGRAAARIVLPDLAGRATVFAAEELREHLERISGARLPLEHAPDPGGEYVSIVLAPRQLEHEIQADGTEDQFTLHTQGRTLTIEGNSETAVLYGVYQVLHDLGVRWYTPGELGTHLPQMDTIELPQYDRDQHAPSFRTREIGLSATGPSHFHDDPETRNRQLQEHTLWLVRNRTHLSRVIQTRHLPHPLGFGETRERQGHNIQRTALGDADLDTEPERFALVERDDTTERTRNRAQICYTHPANIEAAIATVRRYFEEHPHHLTYPLGLQDHAGHCTCADCVEANAGANPEHEPNRVVWRFMDAVAEGVAERFPHRKISLYAPYGRMTHPPSDMSVSPNIVAVAAWISGNHRPVDDPDNPYTAIYREHIERTQAAGADIAIRTYTLYAGTPQPLALLESVRPMHELGAQWYHLESMGRDQQRYIVSWVLAQLLWDVEQDPRELLAGFCEEYYGPAGGHVLEALDLIDESVRDMPTVTLGATPPSGPAQSIMTERVIAEGRAILAEARGVVEGVEAQRLEQFIDSFEMLARNAEVARAYYRALDQRTEASREHALAVIDETVAFWNERDLARVASPNVRNAIDGRVRTLVEQIDETLTPEAGAHVGDAEERTLIAELFALADVPDDLPHLHLLPERWRFRLDVDRRGVTRGWMAPDHDDGDWPELSTWNIFQRQGFERYNGAYWYRLRFDAPAFPDDGRIMLRIGALDDGGEIYLNGIKVHHRLHLRPLDWRRSFEIDVTDALQPGEPNVLAIHGINEYGAGGLWKPTALYVAP